MKTAVFTFLAFLFCSVAQAQGGVSTSCKDIYAIKGCFKTDGWPVGNGPETWSVEVRFRYRETGYIQRTETLARFHAYNEDEWKDFGKNPKSACFELSKSYALTE